MSGSYWASAVIAFLSARQRFEDLSGDVTLETPDDVTLRFALSQAALHVGDSARFVLTEACDHDPPDGVVGVAVAGVVEPELVGDQTTGGWDRSDAAQHRPLRLGGDPPDVVAGSDQQHRGGVGPDAVDVQQFGRGSFD